MLRATGRTFIFDEQDGEVHVPQECRWSADQIRHVRTAPVLFLRYNLSPVYEGYMIVGICEGAVRVVLPRRFQCMLKSDDGPELDFGRRKVSRVFDADGVRCYYRGDSVTIPYTFFDLTHVGDS